MADNLRDKMGAMSVGGPAKRNNDPFATIHDFTITKPAEMTDKEGKSGTELKLLSNFIKVKSHPDVLLYQYHVGFNPAVDAKGYRIRMLAEHREELGTDGLVFDGAILYLGHNVMEREGERKVFRSLHPVSHDKIEITVTLTKRLPPNDPQCITVLNLCNRKAYEMMDFRQFGRHFFNPGQVAEIKQHRIEIWPGMISAIRCYDDGLLLGMEMAHKILRTDSVLEFFYDTYEKSPEQFQAAVTQELVGTSVTTRYNNKMYRVDDILFKMTPNSVFECQGEEMTFKEYYAKQYHKHVTDDTQPLLLSRAKKSGNADGSSKDAFPDKYLVPEFCSMTGLTDRMRADTRVMKDLAQYTRMSPEKRVNNARDYLRKLSQNEPTKELFGNWNLSFDDDLVEVVGRQLPAEPLTWANARESKYDAMTADWSRESKGMKVQDPQHLQNWLFVVDPQDKVHAERFYQCMRRTGPSIGMRIDEPTVVTLPDDRVLSYIKALKEHAEGKDVVLLAVPNDNKARYDAIKKALCLEIPTPSQVLLSATLRKEKILQSVCAKVLMQMNCKMGGSLWTVKIPMQSSRVMVVGYDSYHDSSLRGKSVGAAVFSMDPAVTSWFSQCELFGQGGTECTDNIVNFFRVALEEYRKRNGEYPNRVFFFRDGVGEGQIPVVFNVELAQVKRAFSEIFGSDWESKVKFSFTIVTKRVNTRFFWEKGAGARKTYENPPPGTVVDNKVTRRERYDFYLIPQNVRQGTVTPVSYNVIYDKSGLTPDQMQRFAWKLSHLYYNWQGTIRVPAPCQYAAKLAFLVGQSLHQAGGDALNKKLYFL